ncbi:MAG: AMP-binding protein, partial [Anaerolineales bacterium]|nr:AMP-binding protein [Anaerolineales bacterium]
MLSTNITLSTALQQVASARPEQEALVCGETRLRYAQVVEQSLALANALRQAGIGKGDKIACLLPPGVEFTLLLFAVAELGAVFVPLDPRLRQQQLERVLGDCEAALLVAEASLPREELPGARALRLLLHTGTGEASLRVWIAKGAPAPPGLGTGVAPNDLLALLYTSGTTGTPKATMHSHRSLIAPVVASIRLRELWLSKPNLKWLGNSLRALARYRARLLRAAGGPQTFLSTVGWQTITGLEVMLQALLMGDRLVVLPHFHPRRALELVERERVTILVAVPMALEVMLALEDFDAYDTSSLLICGTGAAPCPPDLARRVQRRFGCAIHIGF